MMPDACSMRTKNDWRRCMRDRLNGLPQQERAETAQCIEKLVSQTVFFGQARAVGFYRALSKEVPLDGLVRKAWNAGKSVLFPAREPEAAAYAWRMAGPDCVWEEGPDRVLQPSGHADPGGVAPDLIFVPGLAFSRKGVRLGRGGGHYDRLLRASDACFLGVARSFQLVDELPDDPHDVRMHGVVTEQEIYRIQNG